MPCTASPSRSIPAGEIDVVGFFRQLFQFRDDLLYRAARSAHPSCAT
ncbi:hypothetical protein KCP75_06630 [Salmonella enterica subsp. enterica]|nr:hypothetical protein KCP75_06630 [Salmonella enterica subsp. enterica]